MTFWIILFFTVYLIYYIMSHFHEEEDVDPVFIN